MNIHEKTLEVENKIIDFLTMICWWTEARFNVSNLGWFIRVNALKILIYVAVLGMWILMTVSDHRYFWFSVVSLIEFGNVLQFIFVLRSPGEKINTATKRYPQGFPNPSRFLRYPDRRVAIFFVPFFWFIAYRPGETDFEFIADILFVLTQALEVVEVFLLSCDSMPPAEKARRRAARGMENTALMPA